MARNTPMLSQCSVWSREGGVGGVDRSNQEVDQVLGYWRWGDRRASGCASRRAQGLQAALPRIGLLTPAQCTTASPAHRTCPKPTSTALTSQAAGGTAARSRPEGFRSSHQYATASAWPTAGGDAGIGRRVVSLLERPSPADQHADGNLSLFSAQATVSNTSTLRVLKVLCHCRGKNQIAAYSTWGSARAAHTSQVLSSSESDMVADARISRQGGQLPAGL